MHLHIFKPQNPSVALLHCLSDEDLTFHFIHLTFLDSFPIYIHFFLTLDCKGFFCDAKCKDISIKCDTIEDCHDEEDEINCSMVFFHEFLFVKSFHCSLSLDLFFIFFNFLFFIFLYFSIFYFIFFYFSSLCLLAFHIVAIFFLCCFASNV